MKSVLDRRCSIGVIGSLPVAPDELQAELIREGMTNHSIMAMKVVFRKDEPPGPAGRAFISQLML